MISMLEYAPLRTAILGRALRKSINELEHCDNVKSVYSHQFLARTDFIEEVGRKRAIESIRESLTNGCLDFDRIELLEWLTGKKFDVATLKSKAGGFEMRLELFDCLFGK